MTMRKVAQRIPFTPSRTQAALLERCFRGQAFRLQPAGRGVQRVRQGDEPEPRVSGRDRHEERERMAQGQSDPVECVEQRHHGFPQGTSAYFRKAQYGKHRPRFASRNDNIQSFRNAMPIRRMDGNRYPLSRKLGSVRIRKRDRLRHPIESLSSWTVKRENRTYCLVLLFDVDIQPKTRAEGRVGIDLGVKDLLTLSTGEKIDYPNRLRRLEEDVKREQRKLSRRTTGSNNYRRQRAIVAKAYAKLRRYRDNFQHQLSHRLIEENQFIRRRRTLKAYAAASLANAR